MLSGEIKGAEDSKLFRGEITKSLKSANEIALQTCAVMIEGTAKRELTEKHAVDTGRLRASITHRVKDNIAEVGTNVEYAPHIEYGTVKMPARSFLRSAVDLRKRDIRKLYKQMMKEILGG